MSHILLKEPFRTFQLSPQACEVCWEWVYSFGFTWLALLNATVSLWFSYWWCLQQLPSIHMLNHYHTGRGDFKTPVLWDCCPDFNSQQTLMMKMTIILQQSVIFTILFDSSSQHHQQHCPMMAQVTAKLYWNSTYWKP
jgi:hypothetical protein